MNYLGGVWMTRALLPGLRPARRRRALAHRERRLRRGNRRLRPVRGLHGGEARPARVLALAAGVVAWERHRRSLDPARIRRDRRVSRRHRSSSIACCDTSSCSRSTSPETIVQIDRAWRPRGRRAVVPLPPRRAALRGRPGARVVARRARSREEPGLQGEDVTGTRRTGGKVAVVTGASSGIGEATARLLARTGWRLRARRSPRGRAPAARDGDRWRDRGLRRRRPRTRWRRRPPRILDRHPAIDLLVNSAGILVRGTFVEAPLDEIERALTVNYLGCVWMTRGLLPGLREAARANGEAHVATIASIGGTIVFTPAAPYSASKHAQVAFSRSLRAALAAPGSRCTRSCPGSSTTPGFPHPTHLLDAARPSVRRRPRARCERGALGDRGREGRGRRAVVSVSPRRDRPGDRPDADCARPRHADYPDEP